MQTHAAVNLGGASSLTISPGIYPSISVSGSGRLTLQPGIYVITGGGFSVSGAGIASGSGVLIYNAGSNFNGGSGSSFGGFTLSGSGALSLTAPTSGPYAGIVIFQSRDNTHALAISGAAVVGLGGGTIYAPGATLNLSGSTQVGGSGQSSSTLIVNELTLSGATGAYQLTDGSSSDADVSTFNWITSPVLTVAAVDDTGTGLDPNEVADLGDAMTYLNQALASFGVNLSWAADGTTPDVTVHFATTTPEGGVADGVLGLHDAPERRLLRDRLELLHIDRPDPGRLGPVRLHDAGDPRAGTYHSAWARARTPTRSCTSTCHRGRSGATFTDSNLTLIDTDADRFMKVAARLAGAGRDVDPLDDFGRRSGRTPGHRQQCLRSQPRSTTRARSRSLAVSRRAGNAWWPRSRSPTSVSAFVPRAAFSERQSPRNRALPTEPTSRTASTPTRSIWIDIGIHQRADDSDRLISTRADRPGA